MKRAFPLGLILIAATGCGLMEKDHSSCGWRFEVIKPPLIHTSTPMLVQSQSDGMTAIPVGHVAGPVSDGTWQHGTPQLRQRIAGQRIGGPCEPEMPRGLSVQEWCDLMNTMKPPVNPNNAALPLTRQ